MATQLLAFGLELHSSFSFNLNEENKSAKNEYGSIYLKIKTHRKDISPIFKNETPSGLKTTYPIIFGIWYGIWCTALHLLQSIDN